ncbi:MAG: YciI family protein [Stackebrandtia sp.]
MNHYMLACYYAKTMTRPSPEALQVIQKDVTAYHDELKAAGAWVFGAGLRPPSTATVVRVQDDKVLTTDGPFAETKEILGGFTIIKVADLDEALEWAEKAAHASTLPVEVRPLEMGLED